MEATCPQFDCLTQRVRSTGFYRNAREDLFCGAEEVWREHGKEWAKAHAFDIQGFPPHWETMGNQDRGWPLPFFLLFSGSGPTRRAAHSQHRTRYASN
jgi:hypothetical protein